MKCIRQERLDDNLLKAMISKDNRKTVVPPEIVSRDQGGFMLFTAWVNGAKKIC